MPDARELLRDGLTYQKGGAYARALDAYRAALAATHDPAVAAEALRRQAHAHRALCDWDAALEAARRSAQTAEWAGLDVEHAEALNAEAAVHHSRGDFERAAPLYERILTLTSDERVLGVALQNLAGVAARSGDLQLAEERFMAAYEHFERADYGWGRAHVLNNVTALALDRGECALAETRGERAIEAAKAVMDMDLLGQARLNHAEALFGLARLQEAELEATTAIGHFDASGNLLRRVEGLRLLGRISEERGDREVARSCYERALGDALSIGAQAEVSALRARLTAL